MNICITGASSGIGREIVLQLIQQNHRVWGIAQEKNSLADLKNELRSQNFFYSALDVSLQSTAQSIYEEMQKNNFIPDICILAAGAFLDDIHPQLDYKKLREAVEINFYGVMNFVDIFLPLFLARNSGQFIAIASTAALKPSLRGIGYPASKAALGIAFRGLDLAYRKQGITFSTIYLGPVATRMWNAKKTFIVGDPKHIASRIIDATKTKRSVYYMPFISTFLARISSLPDAWYIKLTELFR